MNLNLMSRFIHTSWRFLYFCTRGSEPMIAKNSRILLSVVIPTYNEEERIEKTLDSVEKYLDEQPYQSEVVVVDDGSEDRTRAIVKDHAGNAANLRLIQHARNQG